MTNEELRKILVENSDVADEILAKINSAGKQLSDITVDEVLGAVSNSDSADMSPGFSDSGYSFGTFSGDEPAESFRNDQYRPEVTPQVEQNTSWEEQPKSKFKSNEFGNYIPNEGLGYTSNEGVLARPELKALAKGHMKEQYGSLCKNLLLMLLISMGISSVGSLISAACLGTESSGGIIAGFILTIVTSIISIIVSCGMTLGYTKGFLNARRGEPVGSLFAYFGNWFDVFKLNFMLFIRAGWPYLVATIIYYIIAGVFGQDSPLIYVGVVLIIAGLVYLIYKSFAYALAMFLYADDGSKLTLRDASEILKKSSGMMNGYKFNYFIIALSFIGWYIVMYLALYLPIFCMLMVMGVRQEANIMALFIALLILLALAVILILPLMVYVQMTFTEFYDSRCGRDPRDVGTGRSLIKLPLIALVAATVFCIGLAFIPGTSADLQSLLGNSQDPYVGIDDIVQDDDSGNTDDIIYDDLGGDEDLSEGSGTSIVPPAGYEVSYDEEGMTTFYTEDAMNSITIMKNNFAYDDEFVSSIYPSATKTTIGGKDGYYYVDGDEYKIYGFVFNTGAESSFEVMVSDPNVLEQVVKQI